MITALPIDGKALTGRVDNKNWRGRVTALIGDCSPSLNLRGKTDNRTNGVPFPWLEQHRSGCPADANEETMEQYARAYVWHLLSLVVFGDCSGDFAPWMILDFLADWDEKYSWGSAGLAYLYRQLDVTCRKTTKKPCMGGCIWGLSVWMWERFPVGRPEKHPSPNEWVGLDEEHDVFRLPTVAFTWDRVKKNWKQVQDSVQELHQRDGQPHISSG